MAKTNHEIFLEEAKSIGWLAHYMVGFEPEQGLYFITDIDGGIVYGETAYFNDQADAVEAQIEYLLATVR